MEVSARPVSDSAEHFKHKNRLQEYAQRSAIPLPMYQTVNEGFPHAPQFRSTVMIDGVIFKSSCTFTHRKEAEQDVAKIALEGISKKIKEEGVPLIHEDTIFCKSILHEYAVKLNIEKPTYETSQSEGLLPMFTSSATFNGKSYTGAAGRNKKEAEQMAARAVIQSILENSDTRTLMSQIIKSKGKLYTAMERTGNSDSSKDRDKPFGRQPGVDSSDSIVRGKEVQAFPANYMLPSIANSEQVLSGQPDSAAQTESIDPTAKKIKIECPDEQSGPTGVASLPTPVQVALSSGSTGSSDESQLSQHKQVSDGILPLASSAPAAPSAPPAPSALPAQPAPSALPAQPAPSALPEPSAPSAPPDSESYKNHDKKKRKRGRQNQKKQSSEQIMPPTSAV